ncbi:MAG: Uma2 family endonuclease [Candidatus Competibacteraceae bacterium]
MSANIQPTAIADVSAVSLPTAPVWRLSVEQYHRMIRFGILTDDDPVELLEGWLITKMPKNPPHRLSTQLTREAIVRLLPPGWYVDAQEPITTDDSEPEPDVVVVRGERRDYRDHHPRERDVTLVVEVADATLQRDRTLKKRLYGRAGIPTYWIINLVDNQLEVHTEPTGAGEQADYRQRQDYGVADTAPLMLDGVESGRIAARDLLP